MSGRSVSLSGFTLVELAISILVLAVGLTAVLSVATYSIREAREIIRHKGALAAAHTVLDSPAWPTGEPGKEVNGFLAVLEVEDLPLPASAPNGWATGSDATVEVQRRTVRIMADGRSYLTLSRLSAPLDP